MSELGLPVRQPPGGEAEEVVNEIEQPSQPGAAGRVVRRRAGGEPSQRSQSKIVKYQWDAFISHASEDKQDFVRELAERLQAEGVSVWYADFTLAVGDSLRRSIDNGLGHSRFGIVVLSHNFFTKEWPQKELDGLATRERKGQRVVLPVWLGLDHDDVAVYSPMLADRIAAKATDGLDKVVADLLKVIRQTMDH